MSKIKSPINGYSKFVLDNYKSFSLLLIVLAVLQVLVHNYLNAVMDVVWFFTFIVICRARIDAKRFLDETRNSVDEMRDENKKISEFLDELNKDIDNKLK